MKKILTLFISLATIFSFASCQKEISAPKGQHTVRFTCELSEQTKTALIGTTVEWTELDKTLFHVFENGVEATAENLVVELEDGIATVTAIFDDTDATEFKYDAFVASLNTNKKPAVLKEQNATSSSYDPAADVLIAQPIVTTDQNESLELKFCFSREVSINKMTLKGIHEGETVKKVTFTGDKSLGGSFDPAKEYSHTPDDKTITINTDSEVVYFVCAPNTVTPTVVVTTDKAAYTKTFSKSITFNKNELHSFTVNFSDENRTVADAEYTLVTSVSQLAAGDVIVLGCAAKSAAAGAMGAGSYFTSVDATIKNGVLKSPSAIEITLGKSGEYWTLTTSEGVIGTSGAKALKRNEGTNTWIITISEEYAVITCSNSSYGSILYNASSPRFLNYTSGQTAIEIYKKSGVVSEKVNVESISLNSTSATLEVGKTVTLTATVSPDNATDKSVTWSSDHEDVATVENGVVTAVAAGTATITVTTVDGAKTATCEVTVNAEQVIETTIADALDKVGDGKTYQITGVVSNITNNTYGNFDLVDGASSIYIYGLLNADGQSKQFSSMGIAEGDTLTVKGKVITYNTKVEIEAATFVSLSKKSDQSDEGGETTSVWTRCTSVSDITSGGTFIIGYEATAKSGKIIPMKNTGGTASTSAAGYMSSGSEIDMATVSSTSDYEFTVVASTSVDGAVCIKCGENYIGNTNTKNNLKLFTEQSNTTAFGVTVGTNDVFTFKIAANSSYHTLQYNTSSPRFAVYGGTQKDLVVYKRQ